MKKLYFMVAISVALGLSGCTGTDSTTSGTNSNLIGTWSNGCENYDGISGEGVLTFTSTQLEYREKEYDGPNCDETKVTNTSTDIMTYKIGSATQYNNGTSATEIDLTKEGETKFSMYSIENNIFYISDGNATNDGSTAEKRANIYDFTSGMKKVS